MSRRLPEAPPRHLRRRSWREAELAALDFETTGLDLRRDTIVSYGLVPVKGARIQLALKLYEEVAPDVMPSRRSITVHQLMPQHLARAAPLAEARERLRAGLEGRYLLTWFAEVETGFLHKILGGATWRWRRRTVDVRRLAAAVERTQSISASAEGSRRGLAATVARYGLPLGEAHHALEDAVMTAELFLVLASRLEAAGRGTLGHLLRLTRQS